MKKILLTPLFIFLLFISTGFSQESGETKGWPSVERYGFITSCIKEAKANMSQDSARFYCYCMLEKVEAKYPTVELASQITEADMQSEEWMKDIKSCLGGYWKSEEREAFLTNCTSSAEKGGISKEKAQTYCECMLYKVEVRYPNPVDAAELTPEILATPAWQKILKGCLDF